MSKNEDLKSPDRRNFFKKAGFGVGAAGAVAIGLSSAPAKAAVKSDGRSQRKKSAYRETDHVRKYYELARF